MQWMLTDEQQAYQEAVRAWLARSADPATVRQWLDDGDATTFAERYAAEGWAGVGIAEELGGQGGGLVELALTAEELGRTSAPSAAWLAGALAAPVGGGAPAGCVLAVPAEVVPHRAPPLDVDPDGRVRGTVARVLAGHDAETFVVPVEGGLRRVAAGDATVTMRRLLDRSRSVADVGFDGAASEPVELPDGFWVDVAARAAVLVSADALGASQRMLDLVVEYAGQRKQFGVPIGSFQAVKHAAAEMLVGIEAARSAVYYAAASVDARLDDHLLHAAATKAQVTAGAARAADTALTLHGAIGYTWEHDLHLHYQRARLDAVLAGAPEEWNTVIADALLEPMT